MEGTQDTVECRGRAEHHLIPLQSLRVQCYCCLHLVSAKCESAASCYVDCWIKELHFLCLYWDISKSNVVTLCEFSKVSDTLQGHRLFQKHCPVHHLSRISNTIIIGRRHLQWECSPTRKVSPDRTSCSIQRSSSVGPVPLAKHIGKEKLQNFVHRQWFGSGCSYTKEEPFAPSQI